MTDNKKIFLFIAFFAVLTFGCAGDAFAEIPNVLKTLGGRTGTFARQLRSFAFIISGFGIIMFTWAAIFGKINFRHLGYIMISLFFLSGVGLFISYITGGDARREEFKFAFGELYKDSQAIHGAAEGKMEESSTSL